jgi:hypothetical protein
MVPVQLTILVHLHVQGTGIILFNQIQMVAVLQRVEEFILLQEVQAECRQINPGNMQLQTIMQDVVPVRILPTIHIHHPADQTAADHLEVTVVPVAGHLEVPVPAADQEVQAAVTEEGDNLYEMYFNPLKKFGAIYYEI